MLRSIVINKITGLWELIFLRGRSAGIPVISNELGEIREIKLESNERLSETLCLLYDPIKKITIIQRNIFAVGIKGIETFFSNYLTYPIMLSSIQNISEDNKLFSRQSKIKRFSLVVHNVTKKSKTPVAVKQYNKGTSITKVIDAALATKSNIINIDISMGNNKQLLNVDKEDFEVFEDLIGNSNVKKLEVGFVPDEFSSMQLTDFINTRVHDIITISLNKDKSINTTEIIEKMTKEYNANVYLK